MKMLRVSIICCNDPSLRVVARIEGISTLRDFDWKSHHCECLRISLLRDATKKPGHTGWVDTRFLLMSGGCN